MEDLKRSFDQTPWPFDLPSAPEYADETRRIQTLNRLNLDALRDDPELDAIAKFAAKLCDAPTALINIIREDEQDFLAKVGEPARTVPPQESICALAMVNDGWLIIPDTLADPAVKDLGVVQKSPNARFYAGLPLVSEEGAPLGALCILDTKPRPEGLTELQRQGLEVLTSSIKRRFSAHRETLSAVAESRDNAQRLQFMLDSVPDIAWSAAPGPEFDYFNARFTEVTGLPARRSVDDWREVIHPDDFDASLIKLERAMSTASLFDDEWRLRQADGSYRWILSRAVPSSDDPETARWFGTITDIHDRHLLSQERQMLAGELAHRIKNIFSVINGLVVLHARGQPELKLFADTLGNHIRALSRAQEFALRIDAKSEEKLKGLLEVLLAPYGVPGHSAVAISGVDVAIGARATTPLALVFHELATNSAKYGALSVAAGTVTINTAHQGDNVQILWRENGGPAAQPPQETGFGSRLVKMAIEHQLGGTITQDWRAEGLVADISIPSARLAV